MLPVVDQAPDVAAIHLADIKNTLIDIRRNTFLTKQTLMEQTRETSAEGAREGIKERTAIEKPVAAVAASTPEESKKASKGILDFFKDFSFGRFLKLFGLLGIGVLFREKIFEFLKGAFEPLAEFVSKWWKEDMLPAIQGLGKAILGDDFYKFLFGTEGEKGLFGKAADEIGKFYTANIKPLFESIAATETFKSLKTYVSGVSEGLKKVGVAMGIINEDGTVSTAGWLVGAAAFAAVLAVKGPFALLKDGFKLMGNIALLPFKGAATGIKLLSKMGIGLAGIAWDGVKAGFNAIRGMGGPELVQDSAGRFREKKTGRYAAAPKGGGFFKSLGFASGAAFAKAAIIPILAIGAVAAAVFGLKALYDKEQDRKSQQVADATEGGLYSKEQLAYAQQQATGKVADIGDKRIGGYDEGEGAGTFEEYLKFRGETVATGDSVAAQKEREAQRARYDKARAEYEKAVEKERVNILNSLIDSRKMNQMQMLGKFMSGPFQRMIAGGAVTFDKNLDASSSMKALMAWMNQPENTGKPMTLEVLKKVGGINIDPNAQFEMLDRYGERTMTTLGDVGTLEDIGRSAGLIKTRSMVRESLEAVNNVAPGSGSGANQGKVSTVSETAAAREAAKAKAAQGSPTQTQPIIIEPGSGQGQKGTGENTVVFNSNQTRNDILRGSAF